MNAIRQAIAYVLIKIGKLGQWIQPQVQGGGGPGSALPDGGCRCEVQEMWADKSYVRRPAPLSRTHL